MKFRVICVTTKYNIWDEYLEIKVELLKPVCLDILHFRVLKWEKKLKSQLSLQIWKEASSNSVSLSSECASIQ